MLCTLLAGTAGCLSVTVGQAGASAGTTAGGPACDLNCPAGSTCTFVAGVASCACDTGFQSCTGDDGDAGCVNVLTDNDNCSGCGIVCPDGEYCAGGECTCTLTTCTNDGGSVCTNLMADPLNCNACGQICPTAENCVLGECTCTPSLTIAQCLVDGGLVCVDLTTSTTPGGGCGVPDFGCDACGGEDSGVCCNGRCTDTMDPLNCGSCDIVCISGSYVQATPAPGSLRLPTALHAVRPELRRHLQRRQALRRLRRWLHAPRHGVRARELPVMPCVTKMQLGTQLPETQTMSQPPQLEGP